jgi:hypothetical protein
VRAALTQNPRADIDRVLRSEQQPSGTRLHVRPPSVVSLCQLTFANVTMLLPAAAYHIGADRGIRCG